MNGYCQFNTVLQKKDIPKAEPVLATTENKLIEENEDTEYVDDTLLKYINILEKMRK